MQAISKKIHFSTALVASLLVAAPMAGAASQCKSLSQDACAANASCTWVDSYTRKDGREIQAYCRKAPVRSDKQQSSVPTSSVDKGMKG